MDEATSARAALILKGEGLTNVRALLGGYNGWVAAGNKVVSGEKPR
ncbi:MAG: hypothetical protein HYZ58_18505 [Acidobacteria bacterium]|nr:hypothetical protein [Acidobacteriota bacterium]MBI3265123.1 hypothetical protein [Acidobacteriota bacterium]